MFAQAPALCTSSRYIPERLLRSMPHAALQSRQFMADWSFWIFSGQLSRRLDVHCTQVICCINSAGYIAGCVMSMPDVSAQRHSTVKRLVACFVVIVIVSILSVFVWVSWQSYDQHIREGQGNVANLARAAAQHAEDAVREIDAVSAGVLERIEWYGIDSMDKERLRTVFKKRSDLMPQIHGFFVYGKDGNWLLTDKDSIPASANNADRDYFIYHRAHPGDREMHVGKVVKSRSTGDYVVPLSRRINNPDGSFAGVFLVTMSIEYFNQYYAGFHLDDNGIFLISLDDGTILTRRPFFENLIGASVAKGNVFMDHLPYARSGIAHIKSVIDNMERINGYVSIDHYPLVVQAGMSKDGILTPWHHQLYTSLAFVSLVTLGILVFAYALMRQIRIGHALQTQLEGTQVILQKMAAEDSLTGLLNRRSLDELLPLELERAEKARTRISLLMLDIDHFKSYNDLYGHPAGDACIKAVAGALQAAVRRPQDLAVRYGGEEFTALLPNTDREGAMRIAQEIRTQLESLHIEHAGNATGAVTVSIGAMTVDNAAGMTPQAMLKSADNALYEAKHLGRNQVCFATTFDTSGTDALA
ncbi:sensor domain-containing diguanylate cyclase [Pseudomonas viridiflava]|uniref:sensor domain-containing diguanylate cyclase n=1 Tax=Pseudomonas viridiflava TaxID=33069 RepID=UPI002EAC2D3B|nr:sensor domain-containing diguanylate cyclase [Pseudomonas viridiflava]